MMYKKDYGYVGSVRETKASRKFVQNTLFNADYTKISSAMGGWVAYC